MISILCAPSRKLCEGDWPPCRVSLICRSKSKISFRNLRVEVDHEQAKLYGLTPAMVTDGLADMSNGRTVSQVVTEGNRRFDVVIRLSDTDRSTTGLSDLLIDTPSGRVPLHLVANVEETDGPNQILRENGQRRIAVYANTDGNRDRAQIIGDIRGILADTQWPQGYGAKLEGTYQAYEDAAFRIGILSLVSLALIFLVLQSRFRSWVLALIIMGNIPLALIGSVAALWIAGLPLSVASMMGFVTLAGISSRNGILKVSRYVNLAVHEGMSFGPKLVMRGSLERLAPVLLTALSAGLALTPLLRGAGEPGRGNPPSGGGNHLWRPHQFNAARIRFSPPRCSSPSAASRLSKSWPLTKARLLRRMSTERKPLSSAMLTRFSITFILSIVASAAAAQTQKGTNGGEVVVMEGHPIEFVSKGQEITFYILEDDGRARRRPRDLPAAP